MKTPTAIRTAGLAVAVAIALSACSSAGASDSARPLYEPALTAPFRLPVRVARDAIAPWEIALAFSLLGLGAWLLIRAAGRVYQFTLLHMGARVDWSQLLRLSRSATGVGAAASQR